jgi:hypothetical protein
MAEYGRARKRKKAQRRRTVGKASFQKYAKDTEEHMKCFYKKLSEKDKRRYAALEAEKLGYGGQRYICQLLGCSPTTLRVGRKELQQGLSLSEKGIRRSGGGRKKIREKIGGIDEMFLQIVEEHTMGSPMDEDVRWTSLGLRGISQAFQEKGYNISDYVAKQLCKKHGYVKRTMQKTKTVKGAEQRKKQFEKRKKLRETERKEENPVLRMDEKKRGDQN